MDFRDFRYEIEPYKFELAVHSTNDVTNGMVKMWDKYGFFLPIPFHIFEIVNREYYPLFMVNQPQHAPQFNYYQALLMFCKKNQELYICLN